MLVSRFWSNSYKLDTGNSQIPCYRVGRSVFGVAAIRADGNRHRQRKQFDCHIARNTEWASTRRFTTARLRYEGSPVFSQSGRCTRLRWHRCAALSRRRLRGRVSFLDVPRLLRRGHGGPRDVTACVGRGRQLRVDEWQDRLRQLCQAARCDELEDGHYSEHRRCPEIRQPHKSVQARGAFPWWPAAGGSCLGGLCQCRREHLRHAQRHCPRSRR